MLSSKTPAFSRLGSPDVMDEVPRAELLFQKVRIELFGESEGNCEKLEGNCEKSEGNCEKSEGNCEKSELRTVQNQKEL